MSTGTNKERIEQNNLILEDIKTQVDNLPEAGGPAKLNVFVQEEEPETKDGIWVKSSDIVVENYIVTDKPSVPSSYLPVEGATLTKYDKGYTSFMINNEIFYIWVDPAVASGNCYLSLYKYNVDTKVNTLVKSNITSVYATGGNAASFWANSLAVFKTGDLIYIYEDTDVNNYAQNTNGLIYNYATGGVSSAFSVNYTSASFMNKSSIFAIVGNTKYKFGGGWSVRPSASSFDSFFTAAHPSGGWSNKRTMPFTLTEDGGLATTVGTDIYIVANGLCYKYDTVNNVWTELTAPPENSIRRLTAVNGSLIAQFEYNCYSYNIATDTWSFLFTTDVPINRGSSVFYNNTIYMLGISQNQQAVLTLPMGEAHYDADNALIIEQIFPKYETVLIPIPTAEGSLKTTFSDARPYTLENGVDKTTPVYRGTGTEWIKIGGAE